MKLPKYNESRISATVELIKSLSRTFQTYNLNGSDRQAYGTILVSIVSKLEFSVASTCLRANVVTEYNTDHIKSTITYLDVFGYTCELRFILELHENYMYRIQIRQVRADVIVSDLTSELLEGSSVIDSALTLLGVKRTITQEFI